MVLLVVLAAMALLIPLVYAGVEAQRFHLRRVQQELNLEIAHRHAQSLLGLVVQILIKDGVQTAATPHMNPIWADPIVLPGNEDGVAEALVEDTSRRWDLNALKKPDGQIDTALRTVLTRA